MFRYQRPEKSFKSLILVIMEENENCGKDWCRFSNVYII